MLNETHDPDNIRVIASYPTTPAAGGVAIYGDLVGIAEGDEDTTSGETVVHFGPWIGDLEVTDINTGGIAVGAPLFASKATPVVLSNLNTGVFFGWANEVVTTGATATIEVIKAGYSGGVLASGAIGATQLAINAVTPVKTAVEDSSAIFVSTTGSDTTGDGSVINPFATLTKAFTLVTTARKNIFMMPGSYAEAALLTWPSVNGVVVKGLEGQGNVVISNADAAAEVLLINPTVQTASFEAFLERVCISHDAQIGIEINNTATAKKVIIHLKDVSTEQVSTGDSIHVTHTDADNAIRIYCRDCNEIEGLVTFHGANASDKFRAYNTVLAAGLTTSGAVTLEVMLQNCVILAGALTIGDATALLTYRACLYRTDADPSVYSELADGYQA
jgi:hypothetical protein